MVAEVKICGLTRPADAALAERLGATWLGVVFAAGPRRLTAVRAREVATAVALPVFGVFGDASLDDILRAVELAGLGGIQLHGTPLAAGRVADAAGVPVWRVVRLDGPDSLPALAPDGEDAVLVEPRVPGHLGGTGVPLDLAVAVSAREALAGRRMVLAGGLRPDTVREAIDTAAPEVVDVSSGVEVPGHPGIKDPRRLSAFLQAVRDR